MSEHKVPQLSISRLSHFAISFFDIYICVCVGISEYTYIHYRYVYIGSIDLLRRFIIIYINIPDRYIYIR